MKGERGRGETYSELRRRQSTCPRHDDLEHFVDVPGRTGADGVPQADLVATHVEQRARYLLDFLVVHFPSVRTHDDHADVPGAASALFHSSTPPKDIPADA